MLMSGGGDWRSPLFSGGKSKVKHKYLISMKHSVMGLPMASKQDDHRRMVRRYNEKQENKKIPLAKTVKVFIINAKFGPAPNVSLTVGRGQGRGSRKGGRKSGKSKTTRRIFFYYFFFRVLPPG